MIRLLCVALSLALALCGPAAAAGKKKKKAPAKRPAASKPAASRPAVPPPIEEGEDRPQAGEEAAAADDAQAEPDSPPAAAQTAASEAAAPASETPTNWRSESAYAWLEQSLGAEVLKILADHRYLLAYRLGGSLHMAHVQWALLEPLFERAPRLLEAQAAINGMRGGRPIDGKEDALRAVLELPASGVATPRIRSAASVLLDWSAERQAAGNLPLPDRPYATQSWARDFVYRYNAREVRDPSPLVDPFFLELLLAPRKAAEAQAHLKAHVQSRYSTDVSEVLDRDVKSGQLSDELRGWIVKYLDDNRRALRLLELPSDFAALFSSNQLQRELAALRAVSDALSKDPALVETLRDRLAPGAEPAESVRVTLGGLHLHAAPHGDSYDPGDRAALSAAYWIDGPKRGDSVPVHELVFADRGPDGLELLLSRERRLPSGGPHVLAAEAPVPDSRPFEVKLLLHAQGAMPTRREQHVAPAQELEAAALELARADSAFLACDLKTAADAYSSLQGTLSARAGREPFDRLAAQLRSRLKRSDAAGEDLETLQGMLEAVRLDASPKECAFETQRGEQARALLRRLPAGCSRDSAPEVNQLLAAAAQRRRDQDTFWAAVESGRKLDKGCRHPEAAERFAAALAVLDADAAAKCGPAEVEHKTVRERDLPSALAAEGVRAEFQRQLGEAQKAVEAGSFAEALASLNPLLAKIGAHSSGGCYEAERRKGEELASRAGAALASPAGALARIPDSVESTLSAVTRERDRARADAEARRKRELAEQAPGSIEGAAGADGPAKAPRALAPAARKAAVEADEAPARAAGLSNSPSEGRHSGAPPHQGEEPSGAADDGEAMSDEEIATELGLIEAEESQKPKPKPAAKRKPAKRRRS